MLTATLAVKLLRQILQDYNYWSQSESDSALKITRSKGLDDKDILARDAAMRKTMLVTTQTTETTPAYKAPERRIETLSLDQVFKPLVAASMTELQAVAGTVKTAGLKVLESPIERVEFLVQVYSVFNQLFEAKVCYVKDGINRLPDDAYTGFFITGKTTDGQVVVAQTLLTQT